VAPGREGCILPRCRVVRVRRHFTVAPLSEEREPEVKEGGASASPPEAQFLHPHVGLSRRSLSATPSRRGGRVRITSDGRGSHALTDVATPALRLRSHEWCCLRVRHRVGTPVLRRRPRPPSRCAFGRTHQTGWDNNTLLSAGGAVSFNEDGSRIRAVGNWVVVDRAPGDLVSKVAWR
jgi:hypothetical protein